MNQESKIQIKLFIFLIIILLFFSTENLFSDNISEAANKMIDFTVIVYDSVDSSPIISATVALKLNNITGAFLFTNSSGQVRISNLNPGKYNLSVSIKEYSEFNDSINIDSNFNHIKIFLKPNHIVTSESVTVSAYKLLEMQKIQVSTGNLLFNTETFHSSPTLRISDLIQQNVIGAVKAPTGEIHIRGQHGEYSYYIDDVQIPLGIFGGLNEIVDMKAIEKMTILTGGFPAEYGGQTAAIMDIQTIVPTGHFHLDFKSYLGSYLVMNGTSPFKPGIDLPFGSSSEIRGDTLGGRVGPFRAINSNGQSLSLSNHVGLLGYFVSFARQETDRRVDQPTPVLFNDHGTDYFLYSKLDYPISNNDYVTVNLNYGTTQNQVPFDFRTQGFAADNQSSYNAFQTISYFHTITSDQNREKNLFIGFYTRQGGLKYNVGNSSPTSFQIPDDTNRYALSEKRDFNTFGIRSKFEDRLSKELKIVTGLTYNSTSGNELFITRDSLLKSGPEIQSQYSGSDFGLFSQCEYQPFDWYRVDLGCRYDQHIAPNVNLLNQFSPRIKMNFFLDIQNTIYIYYGKLFMPTSTEGLRLITGTSNAVPTLPENDDFYEGTFLHTFSNGIILKTAFFLKNATPGVDDQVIGSSSIKTQVNISRIQTTGIELGLSYSHPTIPLTAFLNTSIIHAYGSGAITGGFMPITDAGKATDLDHDQRLSISAEINYQPKNWYLNASYVFGSGLTNGNENISEYGTGLFDFNTQAHVSPYHLVNVSIGYKFHLQNEAFVEPSIYINNLLDNNYILKGAYFSSASWGERRNVVFQLSLHI